MAWKDTERDKLRYHLRLTIGATMRLSQLLLLAPYPLTLVQRDCCSISSRGVQVIKIFRQLISIFVTIVTMTSQFVLFYVYPHLMYQPTVPIFIVILYYILSILQTMTVAVLMIGCEGRRTQYETYFETVLPLVKETFEQSDCQLTIWHRNTARAALVVYSTIAIILPIVTGAIIQTNAAVPYAMGHFISFVVSYLVLMQYYSVFVHLSSILRKLNERLTALVRGGLTPGGDAFMYIEQLRLLHVEVMEIAGGLNEKIGYVIIMIVVAIFASVNIELLELYQCVRLGVLSPTVIVMKFIFAAIEFSFYILIAYPNRLIQNENQRTLFMLHKTQRASNSADTNGSVIHYILQISNLRHIHQSCGMIPLDMKLITNVVAAITTIVVILIQFADFGL
uniref:Gustatory receptor n=1 Tax=Anopheles dirus TaxID=7168 RepID=A0A182NZ67_9DIPT